MLLPSEERCIISYQSDNNIEVESDSIIGLDTTPIFDLESIEICDNGIDDDLDGFIDDYDSDCPCFDSIFNELCNTHCEILPDSFPQISVKLKWISEHSMINISTYKGFSGICISNNYLYSDGYRTYNNSIINYIQRIDLINGKNFTSFEVDTNILEVRLNPTSFSLGSSLNDIILTRNNLELLCFKNSQLLWKNIDVSNSSYLIYPYLIDINNDGTPEVVSGNYIFNSETGKLLLNTGGSGGCSNFTNFNSCSAGAHSVAGNFTDSQGLEIACGDKLYQISLSNLVDSIGNNYTTVTAPTPIKDGTTAMADMNGDGKLDIIVLKDNFNNDGGLWVWDPREIKILATLHPSDQIPRIGGVPTIIDIIDDCTPEIIIAFKNELRVYKYDGISYLNLEYSIPTTDDSGVNRAAVFDLNGDGNLEIIYRDQTTLRIFDGPSGNTLFQFPLFHGTSREIPIITDVDDDGHSEIIIDGTIPGDTMNRIYCFESGGEPWMPARKIWNQSGYYVTNVNDDMTIPKTPQNTAAFFDTDSCQMVTCPQVYNTFNVQATYRTQKGCVPYLAKDVEVLEPYYECTPDSIILIIPFSLRSTIKGDSVPVTIWGAAPVTGTVPLFHQNIFMKGNGLRQINNDTLRVTFPITDPNLSQIVIRLNAPNSAGILGSIDGLSTIKECNYENNTKTLNLNIGYKTLDLGKDTSFCHDIEFNLNAGSDFESYIWNNLDTTESIIITTSGDWSIITTDQCGRNYQDTIHITIHNATNNIEEKSSCDSIIWNGTTYDNSGIHTYTTTNIYGCDSTETLNLTIYPSSQSNINFTTCEAYTWNGQTYAQSGIYTYPSTNIYGCDSITTLNLTIHPTITETIQETQCDVYTWNGTTYTESGSYNYQTLSVLNCDSIATLALTIHPSSQEAISYSSCDPYLWNGTIYNESGTYTFQTQNIFGCDSTTTLDLTIHPNNNNTTTQTACDTYFWSGTTYDQSGTYSTTSTNVFGCDSISTLNLTIHPSQNISTSETVCASFLWQGTVYDQSGIYTYQTQTAFGCDSTITLNLTIHPESSTDITTTACDSLIYQGQTITESGTYTFDLQSKNGCDSTINLNLTISADRNENTQSACGTYLWSVTGEAYTQSGTYQAVYTNALGCDSTYRLNLTIHPEYNQETTAEACAKYLWTLNNQTYTQSGQHSVTLRTSQGCDSIITLDVTIHPEFEYRDTIITNEPYLWPINNTTYETSGIYTETFSTDVSCDSIHYLYLTIRIDTDIHVPNIISPDGPNSQFTFYGSSISIIQDLSVFDRWGNQVFHRKAFPPNDSSQGWDGKYQGKNLTPGVYSYSAQLLLTDGTTISKYGDVTIIR